MSESDHKDGCSTGCLTSIIIICIFALIVLFSEKNSPMILIMLFLGIGSYCCIELSKTVKKEKAVKHAYTDARALMLELNKDLLSWRDTQRLSFSENVSGKVTILQISQAEKKIAILRFNGITQSADLRVYNFSELKSWKTKVQKTDVNILLFTMPAITHLSVELTFFYKNKIIEHSLTLFDINSINEQEAATQHERLKHIQDFLSYIKPESR